MNKRSEKWLTEAWAIVFAQNIEIIYYPSNTMAKADFINHAIWLPAYVNNVRQEAMLVHEAHHMSTSYERHTLKLFDLEPWQVIEWYVRDEKKAILKQLKYEAEFDSSLKIGLRYRVKYRINKFNYRNGECRGMYNGLMKAVRLMGVPKGDLKSVQKRCLKLTKDGFYRGTGPTPMAEYPTLNDYYNSDKYKELNLESMPGTKAWHKARTGVYA